MNKNILTSAATTLTILGLVYFPWVAFWVVWVALSVLAVLFMNKTEPDWRENSEEMLFPTSVFIILSPLFWIMTAGIYVFEHYDIKFHVPVKISKINIDKGEKGDISENDKS